MQEFRRVRAAIDSLIDDTKVSIKNKSIAESMERLEQARGLVQELKQMATADQAAIVARREMTIADLTEIAGTIKKPAARKKRAKETLEQAATL